MEGISVILPTYNEGAVIYQAVSETIRAMENLGRDYEVIIVDDGSTDSTPLEIEKAAKEFDNLLVVTLSENQGKGNALRMGFRASRKELVCFLDADLDLHPTQITNLLSVMENSGADIVIGSKRHSESSLNYPWQRRLYSTVYYFFIFLLFRLPLKDTQTGIKLFHRDVLSYSFPRTVSKRYVLDLELLAVAHRMGYAVAEAPISLSYTKEYGRIKWMDIQHIVIDTLAIFYRLYILRYYDSPLKPVIENEPRMSIVIPTRELDRMARECVEKSQEVNYLNYDIKLVPDEMVDVELRPSGSRVIPSGAVGPSIKRNIGAADSTADIIAFIDADAWPDFNWLRNAAPYFEDEEVAAVCGPAVTPAADSRKQQASGLIYASSMVSGSTTFRYTFHSLREVDDYPSVNLLVRRSDFEAAGGFHEEFWPGEDTVLCQKLTRDLGKKIIYVPNVIACHHRRPVYLPHLKQVYAYARHRGFFMRKFPETSRRFQYFMPSILVAALLIGLGASFIDPVILYVYLAFLGTYVLLSMLSSVKSLDPLVNLLVFPGIILTHITYGIGLMLGLFSTRPGKK